MYAADLNGLVKPSIVNNVKLSTALRILLFGVRNFEMFCHGKVSFIERGRCCVHNMQYVVTSYNIQPLEVLERIWGEKGEERKRSSVLMQESDE